MKKPIIIISLIITMLVLSACSGSASRSQANSNQPGGTANQSSTTAGASSKDNTKYLSDSYSNALSVPMQLIIGTLKLKDTENEVDAETAKELLTLWKAVKSLSSSDTTSSIEIEALYKQIQRTMTKEQIEAISDMKLSSENMMQISQELGLAMGGGAGMGTMSEEQKATIEAEQASGGGGMMGGPGGGGMPGGGMPGGAPPGQSSSTNESNSKNASQISQVDSKMIDALIKYLETKIQ